MDTKGLPDKHYRIHIMAENWFYTYVLTITIALLLCLCDNIMGYATLITLDESLHIYRTDATV